MRIQKILHICEKYLQSNRRVICWPASSLYSRSSQYTKNFFMSSIFSWPLMCLNTLNTSNFRPSLSLNKRLGIIYFKVCNVSITCFD